MREIPAPSKDLFDVLSNPHRHIELDGSGFVRGLVHGDRLDEVGQKFTMNMNGDHMGGDYQTDNSGSAFDENKMIGWKTAPAGTEPPGWEWLWELRSEGSGSTTVSLTYDWSKVTDQALLKKVKFPLVSEEQLEASLVKLASATIASWRLVLAGRGGSLVPCSASYCPRVPSKGPLSNCSRPPT